VLHAVEIVGPFSVANKGQRLLAGQEAGMDDALKAKV